MKSNKVIITGSIGAGKSTILKLFRKKLPNYTCTDIDDVMELIYACPTQSFVDFLTINFNTCIQKEISAIVFNDKSKFDTLKSYLYEHYVESYLKSWIESSENCVLEFPLFFEMLEKAQSLSFNENIFFNILKNLNVVVVRADYDVRIKRFLNRSELTHPDWNESLVANFLNTQPNFDIKEKQATFVIDNSGHIESAETQVELFCEKLIQSKS